MRRELTPRVRSAGSLLSSGLLLAVLVTVASAMLIRHLHSNAVIDSERGLSGLSNVLADQADRALQSIELVQQSVVDEIAAANVTDPAALAAQMSTRTAQQTMKDRISALPQVNAVTVIDHRGKLLNFSRYWPIPDVNVADRDYFRELTTNPALERVISRPVSNRGDGNWTIYLARKLVAPGGAFLGLVLGAVELPYFEQLYRQIAPAPDYVISMFRTDGVLLARYPAHAGTIGRSFTNAGALLLAAKGTTNGVLRHTSPIDGEDRLIAARLLAHYPIMMSVSRTVSAGLAPWQQQAWVLGAATALLDAGLIGLVVLGVRQQRAQARLARAEAGRLEAEARARGERGLREQYTRFGTALDHMSQGLCMFDAAGCLVVMNERFARMYAIPPELREPGTALGRITEHTLRTAGIGLSDPGFGCATSTLVGRAPPFTCDLADGRSINVAHAPTPEGGWVCTHDDTTDHKAREAQIVYLARHDTLTGLPNRVRLREFMDEMLAAPGQRTGMAVLYLDLDAFKSVNDIFGQSAGDLLLREVAGRLRECTREMDLVARLDGDEFAVVQNHAGQPNDASALAERLIEALRRPFRLDGREIVIGASVGVSVRGGEADSADELLRSAAIALDAAKAAGRGTWRFFESCMDEELQARRGLETDLRRAYAEAHFEVFYQPLVKADTLALVGFEALLRWRHPERGLVGPDEFIPLAEEIGLIKPIGAWVLARACADAVGWPNDLKVAVNLSPVQFVRGCLVDEVEQALSASGLSPNRLELEITESVLLADSEMTLAMLHRLRAMGVRIAMDDFGTGYSSLSYLRRFPFDKIKMDQSFVRGLGQAPDGVAIVRAIVGLGKALNMDVLAEGVETEQQLGILQDEGCDELQGYLFSRPMPIQDFATMLGAASAGGAALESELVVAETSRSQSS